MFDYRGVDAETQMAPRGVGVILIEIDLNMDKFMAQSYGGLPRVAARVRIKPVDLPKRNC